MSPDAQEVELLGTVRTSSSVAGSVDRALLQRRVGNVGLVLAFVGGAFVVMRVIAVLAVHQPERLIHLSMLAHYGGLFASIGMWGVCRVGERSVTTVYAIELVGLALICSLYGVMAVGIPQAFRPEMTLVLAFGVFLLAHAVHVPSSWRFTVLLGGVVAVPLLVGAWLILNPMDPLLVQASASAPGSVQRSAASIINIGMASVVTWWFVIVGTAAAASSVIYGLRREVREARQLGQYVVESKLGEGAMGVVYRANHAMLRRPTAVKVLLPEKMGETGLARFEREVRATARLAHPNTVTIFDYGRTADGLFYYAMELIDGGTLTDVIELTGRMPAGRVARVLHQVAGALLEAHNKGIIHRDIKPSNVMLTERGGVADVAKVVDFGLVKTEDEVDPSMSIDNAIVGTPQFLAPEVIAGTDRDRPARDLYALGCVGYYLLSGEHVFAGETLIEVCAGHLEVPPTPPSERLGAALPSDIEDLILALLAKDADARPDAASVVERLEGGESYRAWSQADARRWWLEHGAALRERRSIDRSADTIALTIDLGDRRPCCDESNA